MCKMPWEPYLFEPLKKFSVVDGKANIKKVIRAQNCSKKFMSCLYSFFFPRGTVRKTRVLPIIPK